MLFEIYEIKNFNALELERKEKRKTTQTNTNFNYIHQVIKS